MHCFCRQVLAEEAVGAVVDAVDLAEVAEVEGVDSKQRMRSKYGRETILTNSRNGDRSFKNACPKSM